MEIQEASSPCFCVVIQTLCGAKTQSPHLKMLNKVNVPHAKLKCIGLTELQKLNETIVLTT